jgi:hypothetical protein
MLTAAETLGRKFFKDFVAFLYAKCLGSPLLLAAGQFLPKFVSVWRCFGMRLTLRTMLAYLDELLEPADREDVGRKIADSEFAATLVERIRNCNRNPRLASPKLTGRGLDPNTVAEYLDNTLAGERVPDFEKVCLESDVYLGEVAASHQILTMVLGQPAQVDPQMKRRMYDVINQVPDTSIPGLAPVPVKARDPFDIGDERARPARSKPEIPDYLRERGKSTAWKPILAAIILFALLIGAITMALGPLDQLIGLNQPAQNQPPQEQVAQPAANPPAPVQPAQNNGVPATNDGGTEAPGISPPPGANQLLPNDSGRDTLLVQPSSIDPRNTEPRSTASPTEPPSINFGATSSAPPMSNSTVAPPTDAGVPPLPQSTAPISTVPPATIESATPLPTVSPTPAPAVIVPTPDVAVRANPTDAPLGRFVPDTNVVLLKFDPATSAWGRLPAGSQLMGGDQLLVMATYRPTISLSSGVSLQVPPETVFTLLPLDANGVPGVKLIYGRMVALTNGKAGAQLRVDVGPNSGLLTFTNAEATVGIETRRYFLAGVNPESTEPQLAADLIVANGQAEWTGRDGTMSTLNAPQRWPLVSPSAGAPALDAAVANQIPKWIAGEPLNANDARASETLVTALDSGKPLLVALREMAVQRRVENREFAAQCLAQLDQYEPLVSAFSDPDQRAMWPLEIACVKAALARGPNAAVAVREAFEKVRGEDAGKDLYRMFWGYSKEQLQQQGEAAKLVGYLEHDNLDFRALAFMNLLDITEATHGYRPEQPEQTRKQPTRLWQEALRLGKIVPKEKAAK